VIGSNVVNEENEVIGKVDDLLVSLDGKEPYAILSIGGFLGMGTHLVAVPYETLKSTDDKILLPGGTKIVSGCYQSSNTRQSNPLAMN
jgi:hypothetical protein